MNARIGSLLVSVLAAAAASAQGSLWIVDEAGGPGVDFTAVQPAVDAASDGDVILLRTLTSDPGFTVFAKSLVVTEDAGATATTGPVWVMGLTAGQTATLRGFDPQTLTISNNAGRVMVEGVGSGTGIPFLPCIGMFSKVDALTIMSSADVVLSRCSIGGTSSAGSPALSVNGSNVHMYDVWAQGKNKGAPGGDGARVSQSSFVFASGGGFLGGCGSDSTSWFGGDGGNGLVVLSSDVRLLEVGLAGGYGGWGPFGSGSDGKASMGPTSLIAGHARQYTISGVAAGGTSAQITYDGVGGDLVLSLVGLGLSPLFLEQHAGTLVLPVPPIIVVHGPASASGDLTATAPLPVLPPGLEAFPVYAQGAAVAPTGAAVLAAPSQLTIL